MSEKIKRQVERNGYIMAATGGRKGLIMEALLGVEPDLVVMGRTEPDIHMDITDEGSVKAAFGALRAASLSNGYYAGEMDDYYGGPERG